MSEHPSSDDGIDVDEDARPSCVLSLMLGSATAQQLVIDGHDLLMQLNLRSEATLILRNFCNQSGKPKLSSVNTNLTQFDMIVITTLGKF